MMKRAGFSLVATLMLWGSLLCAQESPKGLESVPKAPFQMFDQKSQEPVEITSEKLSVDLLENKITFSGQVLVRQGARVIYADTLDASYSKEGELLNILATGHVKMTSADSFAVGENLFFSSDKQTVRLWGNPRLIQGRQMILGEEMIFYIKEDRLNISRPSIEWRPAEGQDERAR
jgi:lipopolysaccharide export system protein LptA